MNLEYCPYCGKPITFREATYCPSCGRALDYSTGSPPPLYPAGTAYPTPGPVVSTSPSQLTPNPEMAQNVMRSTAPPFMPNYAAPAYSAMPTTDGIPARLSPMGKLTSRDRTLWVTVAVAGVSIAIYLLVYFCIIYFHSFFGTPSFIISTLIPALPLAIIAGYRLAVLQMRLTSLLLAWLQAFILIGIIFILTAAIMQYIRILITEFVFHFSYPWQYFWYDYGFSSYMSRRPFILLGGSLFGSLISISGAWLLSSSSVKPNAPLQPRDFFITYAVATSIAVVIFAVGYWVADMLDYNGILGDINYQLFIVPLTALIFAFWAYRSIRASR